MAKKIFISLRLHKGDVKVNGEEIPMKLPKGCDGIMFAFKDRRSAVDWWGNDTELIEAEINNG